MTYDEIIEKLYELIKVMIKSAPLSKEEACDKLSISGGLNKLIHLENNWKIFYIYDKIFESSSFKLTISLYHKDNTIVNIVLVDDDSFFSLFFGVHYYKLEHPKDMTLLEYTLTHNRIDECLSRANIIILRDIDYLMNKLSND